MDSIFSNYEYRDEVKQYISAVKKYISDTQHSVPEEYSVQLRLLADNYQRYLNCIDALRTEGTVFKADNGRHFLSPLYRILKDCEATMSSICKVFGLDTFSRSKIRLQDATVSPDQILHSLLEEE